METIINMSNRESDRFYEVDSFRLINLLNLLYDTIRPDANSLREMLLSVPAVSRVVWCPDNGKWRCAAIFYKGGRKTAMFFPLIFPKNKAVSQKSVTAALFGNVGLREMERRCKMIVSIFKENARAIA